MTDDEFTKLSQAIRAGIDDAYRLGIGAAITLADEQLTQHPHDRPLQALIAALRQLSAQTALIPRKPKEQP